MNRFLILLVLLDLAIQILDFILQYELNHDWLTFNKLM